MGKSSIFSRLKSLAAAAFCLAAVGASAVAQDGAANNTGAKKPKDEKRSADTKDSSAKQTTAEGVAESTILIYGGLGGRDRLNQIRKTAIERGRLSILGESGQMEEATYQTWVVRGDNLSKEKIRFDQEYPTVRYSLVRTGDKTFGVFNNSVFNPRSDAAKTFENRIYHGLEALLRYKENGSKIELAGREKILGVDYHILDLTDTQGRKTRYYISAKSFRVMMIDYEDGGVKYRRKFYDYNYAQGTLVPFRSTLTAGDKLVEESRVLTITFGQKVDDSLFAEG